MGRERELAELRGALEEASCGRGGLFLISGAPGVGKTRLVEELVSLADAQDGGMTALAGHCIDQEGAVPYLPFVEILESCVDRVDGSASPDRLRSLLGEEGPGTGAPDAQTQAPAARSPRAARVAAGSGAPPLVQLLLRLRRASGPGAAGADAAR